MRMKLHFAIFFALFSGLLWASPLEFRLGLTGTTPVQENQISGGEYAHGVVISGLVSETTKTGALREVTLWTAIQATDCQSSRPSHQPSTSSETSAMDGRNAWPAHWGTTHNSPWLSKAWNSPLPSSTMRFPTKNSPADSRRHCPSHGTNSDR